MTSRKILLTAAALVALSIYPASGFARTSDGGTQAVADCQKYEPQTEAALTKMRAVMGNQSQLNKAIKQYLGQNAGGDMCLLPLLGDADQPIADALSKILAQNVSGIMPAAGDEGGAPEENESFEEPAEEPEIPTVFEDNNPQAPEELPVEDVEKDDKVRCVECLQEDFEGHTPGEEMPPKVGDNI